MIKVNDSNTQDINRPFSNLIPTEILVFCLYLSKFAISLVTYPKKSKLAKLEAYFFNYYFTNF